ncbi:hypothetical protein GUJ93_ZPchr0001g32335 [Zizania palustris]|uniref:Uncharacterized protein n=1 Tax=Zizania palustris TaxID=103762 RepID=A0A8J5RMW0_ZIZPA|nr:hypothetical protein GUJ93_ZPchr0001g32335 [Zizania palustris]
MPCSVATQVRTRMPPPAVTHGVLRSLICSRRRAVVAVWFLFERTGYNLSSVMDNSLLLLITSFSCCIWYGFGTYFNLLLGSEWSALMLTYSCASSSEGVTCPILVETKVKICTANC